MNRTSVASGRKPALSSVRSTLGSCTGAEPNNELPVGTSVLAALSSSRLARLAALPTSSVSM